MTKKNETRRGFFAALIALALLPVAGEAEARGGCGSRGGPGGRRKKGGKCKSRKG